MPGRLLSSLLNLDAWDNENTFDSHAWQRHHAPIFEPGFQIRPSKPASSHWHEFVSFKKKKRSMNGMTKCLCPVTGHCVPGFQCPLGEHIDSSKCFRTVTVTYPPDAEYQKCLKKKEEDPEKKCKLKILEDLKIKTGGWFFTGGADHPIAWKVKGKAKEAGIKKGLVMARKTSCDIATGYELIAIDGNSVDWRDPGYKAYVKSLNWNTPPPSGRVECTPGDGCKAPCPLPPPPPLPPPGRGRRFPMAFQQIEAAEAAEAPGMEQPQEPQGPCYPNGHSLTFKVSAPAWMFWAGPKTTCKTFRETCCTEASTREKPEDIFAESCATKEMCKPQETCDQMEGRPGICKYQVLELKGDYDEAQENEDKQEEAAAQAEEQEQQQEQQEEEEEGD
eukprot:symbB.v1.2.011696.t1/scaffold787.1/size162597/7